MLPWSWNILSCVASSCRICQTSLPLTIPSSSPERRTCALASWIFYFTSCNPAIEGCPLQELRDVATDRSRSPPRMSKARVLPAKKKMFLALCFQALEMLPPPPPPPRPLDGEETAARRASRFVPMAKNIPKKEMPSAKVKPAGQNWPAHLPKPPLPPVPTKMG